MSYFSNYLLCLAVPALVLHMQEATYTCILGVETVLPTVKGHYKHCLLLLMRDTVHDYHTESNKILP